MPYKSDLFGCWPHSCKYILEEDDSSLIGKFFRLQVELPTKGDWASTCSNDLKELGITKSLEEIKSMSKSQFPIF
jgi:hypothetical protein